MAALADRFAADAPGEGPDDNERAERIAYCIARGIDPFEIVADGGCEAWMAVTEHNLRAAPAALADAPGDDKAHAADPTQGPDE